MQLDKNYICIGTITAAFGIKGYVKVQSFSQPVDNIFKYNTLYLDNKNQIELKFSHKDKDIFICQTNIAHNRDEALQLINKHIYIKKNQLQPIINQNEYYTQELIGLKVLDQNNNDVGKVKNFYNFGAGDIIEIKFNNGNSEMLPFLDKIFPIIDLKQKIIIISTPEYK